MLQCIKWLNSIRGSLADFILGTADVRWHLLWDFICFLPDNNVIVTSLQYLVWCITHCFSYEDKRLTQHWTMHNVHPLTSGIHDSKHAYVPTAGILSTWCKLICVDKQENSIPHEHLRWLNVFITLNWINCAVKAVWLTIYISQGSAAADLRGSADFSCIFLRISFLKLTVKNHENWSAFVEVIASQIWPETFDTPCTLWSITKTGYNFIHLLAHLIWGHRSLPAGSDAGYNQTCQISRESVQGVRSPREPKMTFINNDLTHHPYNSVRINLRHCDWPSSLIFWPRIAQELSSFTWTATPAESTRVTFDNLEFQILHRNKQYDRTVWPPTAI